MTDLPHGDRRRYRAGCGCVQCRAANAMAVQRSRQGTAAAALVDAAPARDHLFRLRAVGVGARQAAKLAGLSQTLVKDIAAGRATRIRPDTAARLLRVRPLLAPGQRVAATRTRRWLDSLHREGFTQQAIARRLGLRAGALRVQRRLTVRRAVRLAQLAEHLTAENPG